MSPLSGDALTQWLERRLHEERRAAEVRHHLLLEEFAAFHNARIVSTGNSADSASVDSAPAASDESRSPHDVGLSMEMKAYIAHDGSHHIASKHSVDDHKQQSFHTQQSFGSRRFSTLKQEEGNAQNNTGGSNARTSETAHAISSMQNSRGSNASQSDFVHKGSMRYTARTPMAKFVTGKTFDLFFGAVIFLNMVVIALRCQYNGLEEGYKLRYHGYIHPAEDVWGGAETAFLVFDWFFCIIYTIEIALKLYGLRWDFWLSKTNFVILAIVILFWFSIFFHFHADLLQFFRLIRLIPLLHLIHHVRGVECLLLIFTALRGSVSILAWAGIMLFGALCCIAFLMNQVLMESVMENLNYPHGTRAECFKYYGTFSRSIFSLFELCLANWIPQSRFLMEDVNEFMVIFCLVFKLTFGFAVIGVLNACFIKETFKTVSMNREMMAMEATAAKQRFAKEMLSFMKHADRSNDGTLTREEFETVLSDQAVKAWLGAQGLDASDASDLFELMDDGSGTLESKELVQGVGKLKGPARSLDLAKSMYDQIQMESRILLEISRVQQEILKSIKVERLTMQKEGFVTEAHMTSV